MVVSRITTDAQIAQKTTLLTLLEKSVLAWMAAFNWTLEAFQKNVFLIHAWVAALLKFGQNSCEYFLNPATNPFPEG